MEKFVKWDKEKINTLIRKISSLDNETVSKEDAIEILTMLNSLLSNKEIFVKETPKKQLKNVTNFNQETLDQIRPYFENPYNYIMGHGTLSEDLAQSIIKEGLKADSPNLDSSFIALGYNEETFESIKHWKHKNCKYIILAAFNDVRVMPVWKELDKNTFNNLLDKSRIIGYIDVENQSFIKSPYYKEIQTINPEFNKFEDGTDLNIESITEIIANVDKLMAWGTIYCNNEHSDFLRENVYDAIMYQLNNLAKKLELQVDKLKTHEEIKQEKKEKEFKLRKNDETKDLTQSFDGEGWETFDNSEWDEQSNQEISLKTQDLLEESREFIDQTGGIDLSTLTPEQIDELQNLGYIETSKNEQAHSKML